MHRKTNFRWNVRVSYEVFPYLAGIKLREFHLQPSACAKSYRIGRKRIKEIFGREVSIPVISCPAIAYGHIACLGAKVTFPEDSAPKPNPIYSSIDDGIKSLRKKINFEDNKLFKDYLKMHHYLQKEFSGEKIYFNGFDKEGPVTSAVILRGEGFYVDLYDYPEKTKEFLGLLTDSIIKFDYFLRRINKAPKISSQGDGLCDDFSSLISPNLWPEFVLPYWEQYYRGTTTGSRRLHCENLSPGHLKHLTTVGITSYDPDRSSKLSPRIIKQVIDIPFAWSLQSFHYPQMTKEDIKEWVPQVVGDGASSVYTYIYPPMCKGDTPEKVRIFIETAKKIEEKFCGIAKKEKVFFKEKEERCGDSV